MTAQITRGNLLSQSNVVTICNHIQKWENKSICNVALLF